MKKVEAVWVRKRKSCWGGKKKKKGNVGGCGGSVCVGGWRGEFTEVILLEAG